MCSDLTEALEELKTCALEVRLKEREATQATEESATGAIQFTENSERTARHYTCSAQNVLRIQLISGFYTFTMHGTDS